MLPVLALVLLQLPTPLLVQRYDLGYPVQVFAVAPDGSLFAAVHDGNQIDLFDTASGKLRHGVRFNDGDRVRVLTFSPDGKTLAGGADSNAELCVWSVESGQQVLTVADHAGGICAIAFAPDGKTIATAARDGRVRLVEAESGKVRLTFGERRDSVLSALAFDPAGRWLAVATAGKPGRLFDPSTGQPIRTLAGDAAPEAPLLAVSADGRTLLTARADLGYDVWEAVTGKRRWMTRPDALQAAAFARDGRSVALVFPKRVEVRGPRLGETGIDLPGKDEWTACAIGGGRIFVAGSDVRVWRWPELKPRVIADAGNAYNSTFEELAELLAGPDAARAHAAIGTLLARDPAEVVRMAKVSLRPVSIAGTKAVLEVRKLVPELSHSDFRVREAASQRLQAIGRAAPLEVLKAAKDSTDPEAAARLAKIIRTEKLQGLDFQVESVRWLEVLEVLDTPAARAVVAELAAGDTSAELTRDAIETLKRMRQRRVTSSMPARP